MIRYIQFPKHGHPDHTCTLTRLVNVELSTSNAVRKNDKNSLFSSWYTRTDTDGKRREPLGIALSHITLRSYSSQPLRSAPKRYCKISEHTVNHL
ncbi:hypothetical protein NPIL_234501 [Nephila pilipes]|uniref:Uncharacterized protein n=1 Tax=Nephila pilipes TaxID=299642 RepID=A0A8X6PY50_NEPPI|nr:hypothetical protein NPIL_234501 [Nephila pilipes]